MRTIHERTRVRGVLMAGAVFVVLASSAFGSETPEPKAERSDPMQIARGARSWAAQCGRCHSVRDPKELRDDQWRAVMSHMRVRAHLTGGESRDILRFLQETN